MDWLAIFKEYGLPITMLGAFAWSILKGWLVPGKTHEDVKAQRDRLLNLALKATDMVAKQDKAAKHRTASDARGKRGDDAGDE